MISYDALGHEAEARFYDVGDEAPNRLEVKEYDISGNVIRIFTDLMDGRNGETLTRYDTLNREVRRVDILGRVTEMRYDALGRTISVGGDTYPLKSGYDTQGRKISGSTTRDNGLTWDETTWEFDSASGVNTAKVYADGTRIAYNYTDNGRKTRTTWARGVWKLNAYNERNLVSGTTYSDSATPSVAYTYSNAGKMASASLSDGTAYSYDYDNRLLNTAENITIAGEGYLLPRTYDDYRRNVKTSVVHTNVHHAAKMRIYDSENRVCGYALTNAAGRGVTVNVSYIGSYQNGIMYTLPNGNTFTVEYDREAPRKHLVTNRRYRYGNQQMYSYSTEYDLLGRPMNATDSLSTAREWLYNNRNELASAVIGTNSFAYAYDSIGNREWAALNSATNTYVANSLNQYSQVDASQFVYDADGNLTQDGRCNYTYDAENRLVSVVPIAPTEGSLSINNRYDHKGLRIGKTVKRFENGYWKSHATHTFIFDGGNIVLERIAKADGKQVIKEYFWGMDKSGTEQGAGGVGGLLAVSVNGVFSIPCYDHNGNIVAYVSETGGIESLYVYDAYGNTIEKSGEKADVHSFGFSTKYHDRETGMIGYQRRFYCPDHGRWLNRDPIEEEGGENLYAFCVNNPILNADVNGEAIRVEQSGTQITVILNITIYYANNIEKRANTDLDRIARRIKNQIESQWNNQTWRYQCCTVSFRANVTTSRQVGSQGLTNDNLVAITTDANHRSYVIGMNRGVWAADNRRGSDWTFAHEAGHLMGLDDDYTDENGPNPGHEGHMMAEDSGVVDVHEVMDIIRKNNIRCSREMER